MSYGNRKNPNGSNSELNFTLPTEAHNITAPQLNSKIPLAFANSAPRHQPVHDIPPLPQSKIQSQVINQPPQQHISPQRQYSNNGNGQPSPPPQQQQQIPNNHQVPERQIHPSQLSINRQQQQPTMQYSQSAQQHPYRQHVASNPEQVPHQQQHGGRNVSDSALRHQNQRQQPLNMAHHPQYQSSELYPSSEDTESVIQQRKLVPQTRSFSEGVIPSQRLQNQPPLSMQRQQQQLHHPHHSQTPQQQQHISRTAQAPRRTPSLPPINTQNAVPQRHYQPSPSTSMPNVSYQQSAPSPMSQNVPYGQQYYAPYGPPNQQQQEQQQQVPPPQLSYQQQPHSQQQQQQQSKSPILRNSLSFLRGSRNMSTSSISSDFVEKPNGSPPTNNSNGSSYSLQTNSTGLEKYHSVSNRHQTTSSGRVIPQKTDIANQGELPKKSRSLTSLTRRVTSSTSLRNSADKEKLFSSPSISSKTIVTTSSRIPYVYPAVLSRVAKAFKERIQLGSRYKNGLEYRDSFTGTEAVDVIARIIRTSDRNLALLLGRSLDAQKFFHDVTYEHRLRDSSNEVYQFAEEVFDPYNNGTTAFPRHGSMISANDYPYDNSTTPPTVSSPTMNISSSTSALVQGSANIGNVQQASEIPIIGVFTLLTECYSPTCSRDSLCYSIACPRRLEQQARLGMKSSGLSRSDSHVSLSGKEEQKAFWSLTVPKKVLESIDKREIKRQECIFETIYSERDFVKDLEYVREFWIRPLSETKIIRENEREHFVNTVFYGINEIWDINAKFAEALTKRQQEQSIVKEVGDLFLEFIPKFEPFIKYGAGQVMGKYEFDRQKRHNPFFVRFIEDTSNRVESRRLDVSSYLSKPTSRPARYPLLLKSIRDHTDPSSKDYEKLNKAIEMLQKMLTRINHETGKAADRLNLFLLKQKLVFRPGELVDLKLTSENRKLLYQCVLKKRNYQDKEKQGEVQVYLFDHALLFVRIKIINKREVYRVYQRPIPLPLLFVSLTEESPSLKMIKRSASTGSLTGSTSSLLFKDSQTNLSNLQLNFNSARCPMSFAYLGRNGYDLTLYATPAVQKILIDKLEAQTTKMIEDNDVFTLSPLSSKFFDYSNKINCVVPFDGGRKLLYGTDSGIYVSDVKLAETGSRVVSKPVKIIGKINIIQAEILDEYQMLLVLSDKKLLYWSLDVLNSGGDATKNAKLSKELMTHVSFFKVGVCSGRMLVCAAKSSSNLIRIFEPIDPINQKKQKKKFSSDHKDVNFNSEPVSISFLKTKLCVGCSKGFEIVSLETSAMEQLLDPADTSLDFAIGKEGLKPLEIDRINSDFLLSYSNFSFFINHNGWRSRSKWIIYWEGLPHAFALWYPYLLAFDNGFIEIRHVETGELIRVIVAENIRFLHSSSQEILYAYEDEKGYDVVASLDFWDKTKKNRSRASTITEINTPSTPTTSSVPLTGGGNTVSGAGSGSGSNADTLSTIIDSPIIRSPASVSTPNAGLDKH